MRLFIIEPALYDLLTFVAIVVSRANLKIDQAGTWGPFYIFSFDRSNRAIVSISKYDLPGVSSVARRDVKMCAKIARL